MNNSHQYHTSTSAAVGADSTTNFRSSGVSACLGQDSCQLHNQKAMQMWGTRAVRADSTTNFRSSGVSACLGQDSCQLQNQKAMQMLGTRTVKHFMERQQRPQEVHQQEDESTDPHDLDPQTEHLLKNISQTSNFNRTTHMQMQISATELNVDQDVDKEEPVKQARKIQLKDYEAETLPLQNMNESGNGIVVPDMCDLPSFHDAAILYNLKCRHESLTAPPLTHLPERKISKITSKDWLSNGSLTAPLLTKSDRELFDDFDQMKPSLHNSMVNGGATDLDVLSGRGAMTNAHPGNIRYRKLIEDYKPEYAALTSKQKKCAFTVRVMEEIKGYGGRFLTKACVKGPWVVKKPNAARKKISQSLRE